MRPLEDSPLDHMNIDHERSSFLNGSEADPDDFADLPPPPMIDSKGDPYLDYPDDNRTPTPPPSPDVSPFNTPRPVTPENGESRDFDLLHDRFVVWKKLNLVHRFL